MTAVAPKRILISGWYGHGNTGDEALLRVFCREIRSRMNADITVLSEDPKGVQDLHPDLNIDSIAHYPLLGWEGLQRLVRGQHRPLFRALRQADLFVLGGGSILRDNTTWKNFFRVTDELWLAKLLGVPAALYAVGVGPFRTPIGKALAARAAASCRLITVRDSSSQTHLTDRGLAPERVEIVTDPAFLLQTEKPALSDLGNDLNALLSGPGPVAFVYPAQLFDYPAAGLSRDEALSEVARGLENLRNATGLSLVFVPMQETRGHSDTAVARTLIGKMKNAERTHVLERVLKPEQVKYLTTLPDINICIRLHAFVFAASEGCKALAINYEPKVRNNARTFGVEDHVVDIDGTTANAILDKGQALLSSTAPYIPEDRLEALRHNASRMFDRICAVM